MKILLITLAVITVVIGGFWTISQKPDGSITINESDTQVPVNTSGQTNSQSDNQKTAPLPTGEDIIRTFFNLISEKRIPEAISMMDENLITDDSAKQAWGVQFNAIEKIVIQKIESWLEENWTESQKIYKATLNVEVDEKSENAPIPYYGWDGDPDVRWITLKKVSNNLWKISGIATGP